MQRNLFIIALMILTISCNQSENDFSENDLLGKWTMYRGEVVINGQNQENPATSNQLIGFEFFDDKTGLTTMSDGKFTWRILNGKHLISKKDTVEWEYSIKRKSRTELELWEEKADRIYIWKLRKGWD